MTDNSIRNPIINLLSNKYVDPAYQGAMDTIRSNLREKRLELMAVLKSHNVKALVIMPQDDQYIEKDTGDELVFYILTERTQYNGHELMRISRDIEKVLGRSGFISVFSHDNTPDMNIRFGIQDPKQNPFIQVFKQIRKGEGRNSKYTLHLTPK